MRITIWACAALAAGPIFCMIGPAAAQQKQWAAAVPDSEQRAHIGFGKTEEAATKNAMNLCKRASKTCAAPPPSLTDSATDTFAIACCTVPRTGCAIYAGADQADARKGVLNIFEKEKFSSCTVHRFYSAKTGKPL